MAVIAAFELDDLIPPRVAARQTNCAHGRFRTGTDHANLLDRGHELPDLFGDPGFQYAGRTETQALARSLNDGLKHFRVTVPENHRTPRAHVIDEAAAVFTLDPGTPGAFEKYRFAADTGKGAYGRIDAAGNDGLRVAEKAHDILLGTAHPTGRP